MAGAAAGVAAVGDSVLGGGGALQHTLIIGRVVDLHVEIRPHRTRALLALGERSSVLKKLNLNGCEMVTDAGLSWLAKGCGGLEWIDMTNCAKVTNGGMRCLGEGCPDLQHCSLAHLKRVTDVGLRFLIQGCAKLQHLNATGVFLLSDGMKRDFGFEQGL